MLPDININVKPDPEMETLDIVMVVNLVVVAVAGKFSFLHKYSIVNWFQQLLVIYWPWLLSPT